MSFNDLGVKENDGEERSDEAFRPPLLNYHDLPSSSIPFFIFFDNLFPHF